jgi:hypothetical protein
MTTTSPPTYASSDFINIVGTANITQGTGTIGFVHRVPQAKVRAADPASPVRLRPSRPGRPDQEEVPAPFQPSTDRRPGEDLEGVVDAAIRAKRQS